MARKTPTKKSDLPNETIEIPLQWETSDDVPTVYVNELLITHTGKKEFYLIFGEVSLPFEMLAHRSVPNNLAVKPLVKVAITAETMIEFAKTINANLSRYLSRPGNSDTQDAT